MSEIKQNLKKLYKIFKSTEFPFYNKGILENKNKNIFLKSNYKPKKKESLLNGNIPSNNLFFISRLFPYEKYNPNRKLKSGIIKIKSLDKSHPDFKLIENNKAKIKTGIKINNINGSNLYKVRSKILGSEFAEENKINNNLLNLFNEKQYYEYKILFQKFTQKNKKIEFFTKYKNAQTNTCNSLTERNNFSSIPPIKNKLLKKYFECS